MSIRENGQDTRPEIGAGIVNRAEILAEITALCEPLTPVSPIEVTVKEMAMVWGCSASMSQTALDRQVDAGALTRRKALNPESGRECWAYRISELMCAKDQGFLNILHNPALASAGTGCG